jgi:hypothetical protein
VLASEPTRVGAGQSLGDLTSVVSADCLVIRKSCAFHPQNIHLFSDSSFHAVVGDMPRAASRKKPRQKQGGIMKQSLARALAAVVLVLAMAVPVLAQQTGPMKVTVPFNFVVENERIPAGNYTIERIANGRLRIHTKDGQFSTTFLVIPTQGRTTSEEARLVFRRYGSEYFLAKIWTPGQEAGWEVLQGKLETELAKKKNTRVETATLMGR